MKDSDSQRHLLFTPGPLTTSPQVKREMLVDCGSREPRFIEVVREIRNELLELAGVRQSDGYEAVPMQGSGTFGIESAIGSLIPDEGKLLVVVNGAYGRRIVQIAERLRIAAISLEFEETELPDPGAIDTLLRDDRSITHVALVHCETTTGILNPIDAVADLVSRHRKVFLVDAMSSFGGIPINVAEKKIDVLISSANKCLEGVPGFSFVLTRRELLENSRGNARSVSLDLVEQWEALEKNGQFRFTPPTHALLAFREALRELREEGGVTARYQRYRNNHTTLVEGMSGLGFESLLSPELRSPVITTFVEPDDSEFDFTKFYEHLAARNLIIYPGKLSRAPSFRIGTIGKINSDDIHRLLTAVREFSS
ncbi:MAG: 2-aminoethylphosphonate--pyruvate transaminase [Verrucomicrobiales bacterium]|nr:2-aminoethylphosphonate--pyruvate transaminase [Verrucomicrobiales bacterium]